jgi:hypothetical protein
MVARCNRLVGRDVVSFDAFNHRLDPRFIRVVRKRVIGPGARSSGHRLIQRDRVGRQLSADDVLLPAGGRLSTLRGRMSQPEAATRTREG